MISFRQLRAAKRAAPSASLLALQYGAEDVLLEGNLRAAQADLDMVQTPILGLFLAYVGRRAHMR
jgi:hypothetical protein